MACKTLVITTAHQPIAGSKADWGSWSDAPEAVATWWPTSTRTREYQRFGLIAHQERTAPENNQPGGDDGV